VAEALDYTHSRGIVHRDIKPSNVLIDARGEALLTDFGIAKMVEGTQGLTGHGVVGTPTYMSPEQAQGIVVDYRSDIYSLGIILYEALVGHPPFEAETPVALLMKHVHATLPIPRAVKPEISPALEKVVLKALAKDPADRYQTAGEMKRAMETALMTAGQGLTQFSAAPPAAPPPTPALTAEVPFPKDQPVEPRQNNRLPMIVGIGLALILVAALSGGAVFWASQEGETGTPTQALETTVAGVEATTPAVTETPTTESEPAPTDGAAEAPSVTEEAAAAGESAQAAATATPRPPATPTPVESTATPAAVATVAPALLTPTPVQLPVALNVTDNPALSDHPHLALDGADILHFGWIDRSTGKTLGDFLHRQMTPDGQWSEMEVLSADFDSISPVESIRLIRNPATGQMCAFWAGASNLTRPDTLGLYMRCQAEGGWSPAEKVHDWRSPGYEYAPAFAPDGALRIALIHQPQTVLFGDVELSDGVKTVVAIALAIDQAGGHHAVWVRQGTPHSLEYRYSNDNGQTWQEAEPLTDDQNSGGGLVWPFRLMADTQGNVHLVFVSQNKGIFYRRWQPTDGWGPSVEVTQGEESSRSTSLGLAIDSEGVPHVVWHGFGGVFYTQMLEDETWSKPYLVTDTLNTGAGPDIAVNDDGVRHFVWQVEDDALDIYYANLPGE
jgi:hypothetical protein